MPKLYNVSSQFLTPVRISHSSEGVVEHTLHTGPSVPPGEGFEFTAEEAKSMGAEWSTEDPRAGLEAETAFKAKRDKTEASPAPENTESGDTKEN